MLSASTVMRDSGARRLDTHGRIITFAFVFVCGCRHALRNRTVMIFVAFYCNDVDRLNISWTCVSCPIGSAVAYPHPPLL